MLDTFVSTTMARRWDQGLVAGTGTVGAVLHGTPARHVIDLTHEEFFFTVMDRRPAPDLAPVLPEVRRLLLAHAATEAAALVDERARAGGMTDLIWTDPFVPAASVTVDAHLDGTPTDYRRTGRLDTGEVSVSWRVGDAAIELTLLPLRDHDAIVLRIASTAALTCALGLRVTEERGAPIDSFAGVDSSAYVSAQAGVDGDALTLAVQPIGRPDCPARAHPAGGPSGGAPADPQRCYRRAGDCRRRARRGRLRDVHRHDGPGRADRARTR